MEFDFTLFMITYFFLTSYVARIQIPTYLHRKMEAIKL